MFHQHFSFATNIEAVPLLFKVICLIGLSWQLFELSSEYLKYKVIIRATLFIPDEIEDLSMGICLPVAFAIDYNKFNNESGSNWTATEFDRKGIFQSLSVHEIYNYTYDADKIISEGGYWKDPWGWESKSTNLSSIMTMQKYFASSSICYLYSVRSFKPVSIKWVRGSSVIYLYFGQEISATNAVLLFIGQKDGIPISETIKARYIFRGNCRAKLDKFQSSHYSIKEKLLPPPHETACRSFSSFNFTSNIECIENCIVLKSFKKWGAISNVSLLSNKVADYKFINVSNYTKYKVELDEIRLSCLSSCPNKSCENTQLITVHESDVHVGAEYFFKKNASMLWQRQIPSIPSVTISCSPSSFLTEVILYMMSSISTWTGMSMMSINPLVFLRSLTKTKSTPCISISKHRRHRKIIPVNHTDRISRFEDCLVSQSLAIEKQSLEIEKLKELPFHAVDNRSMNVR